MVEKRLTCDKARHGHAQAEDVVESRNCGMDAAEPRGAGVDADSLRVQVRPMLRTQRMGEDHAG